MPLSPGALLLSTGLLAWQRARSDYSSRSGQNPPTDACASHRLSERKLLLSFYRVRVIQRQAFAPFDLWEVPDQQLDSRRLATAPDGSLFEVRASRNAAFADPAI